MSWLTNSSSTLLVFSLGLCIMNGKQVEAFNVAIYWFGFLVTLITILTAGSMSIVLTNSFSEMVSVVPFSGGCYGYVRCALGPLAGFLTGIAEAGKYLLYTSMMAYFLGDCFLGAFTPVLQDQHMPGVWLAFFCLSLALQCCDRRVIWWVWGVIAITALGIQFIFIFGAVHAGDAANLHLSVNGFQEMLVAEAYGTRYFAKYPYPSLGERFIRAVPLVNFLFVGIDAVRTCANDPVINSIVPKAMVQVHYLTIIMMLATLVAARAYVRFPYELVLQDRPYNLGMMMTFPGINRQLVNFLTLPGVLGCALGFSFASGRQVRSMASSGLLPAWLSTKDPNARPLAAMVTCSLLSFSLLCSLYYDVVNYLMKIIILAELLTCLEAIAMAMAYLIFATRFSGMQRGYTAWTGTTGALLLIPYFLFNFATMFKYGYGDSQSLGLTLLILIASAFCYYQFIAAKRQFYSKEEQDQFMKAYVVNANQRRVSAARQRGRTSHWIKLLIGYTNKVGPTVPSVASGAQAASKVVPMDQEEEQVRAPEGVSG